MLLLELLETGQQSRPMTTRNRDLGHLEELPQLSPRRVDDRGRQQSACDGGQDVLLDGYEQPVALARHILRHVGRHLATGSDSAWSFLIRTPEMVQRGILSVLAERLGAARIRAGKRQLAGSTLTFDPDLVFDGGVAVGDVRYKLSAGDWERADLYEVIAFAEAHRARRTVIVRFREPGIRIPAELAVGDQSIRDVWDPNRAVPEVVRELDAQAASPSTTTRMA